MTSLATTPVSSSSTVPCANIASGAIRPDSRVNYAFGMVLGLDDFQQEQLYHVAAGYRHQHGLHGYGVVDGLRVLVDGAQVRVTPGSAVDQWGRTFAVSVDQCADVQDWLDRNDALGSPPEVGPVYVVASYAECLDEAVPIPGQPCTSSDTASAPSRIRDSWNIEFRSAPPPMPAWDAVRRLADLLREVRVVPGPTTDTDRQALLDTVASLDGGTPLPQALHIGASGMRETLDEVMRSWVDLVRPRIDPVVGSPDALLTPDQVPSDPAILLGTIRPASGDGEAAGTYEVVEDDRPVLMNTQLLQELAALGVPPLPVAGLVTVHASTEREVLVWVHGVGLDPEPGSPVEAGVELVVDGVPVAISRMEVTSDASDGSLIRITPDLRLGPQARIEVRLLLDVLATPSGLLRAALDDRGIGYLDRTDDDVRGYTVFDPSSGPGAPAAPPHTLATTGDAVVDVGQRTPQRAVTAWFHLPDGMELTLPEAVRVWRSSLGDFDEFVSVPIDRATNAWAFVPKGRDLVEGERLRVYIDLSSTFVADERLADWLDKAGIVPLDVDDRVLTLYQQVSESRFLRPVRLRSFDLQQVGEPFAVFIWLTLSESYGDVAVDRLTGARLWRIERDGSRTDLGYSDDRWNQEGANLFSTRLPDPTGPFAQQLILTISLKMPVTVTADGTQMALHDYMLRAGVRYEGMNDADGVIEVPFLALGAFG